MTSRSEHSGSRLRSNPATGRHWYDDLDHEPQEVEAFFIMVSLVLGKPDMDFRNTLQWQVAFNTLARNCDLFNKDINLGQLTQRYSRWLALTYLTHESNM